jgi:hypothetical protein
MKLKEVRNSALSLPERSRAKLLRDLVESFKGSKSEADWVADAEARIDAYDRGELKTLSGEKFVRYIEGLAHAGQARRRRPKRV